MRAGIGRGTPSKAKRRARRASIGVAAALIIAMLAAVLPGSALASPFREPKRGTEYVGTTAGNNSGCASPGFTSIQDAIDAAPNGGTVYLCGNNSYTEPVVISNKRLTLTGDKGATIEAPSTWPDQDSLLPSQLTQTGATSPCALVMVWGKRAKATVRNLTLAGPFQANCGTNVFGMLVIGGATATIRGNSITDIRYPGTSGAQTGIGIEVGRMYWPGLNEVDFVGHATISGNTITGYEKNGMTIDGSGSSAEVTNNTVTGAGPVGYIAQNGIQFSRGASGSISGNRVSGNAYAGSSNDSSGITLFGGLADYTNLGGPIVTNVQISGNWLMNNDVGIYLSNLNHDGTASPTTPTRIRVIGNIITSDAITNGIYQAGVVDYGNQDTFMLNVVSGTGYTGSANGIDVESIDLSVAISPHSFLNIVR